MLSPPLARPLPRDVSSIALESACFLNPYRLQGHGPQISMWEPQDLSTRAPWGPMGWLRPPRRETISDGRLLAWESEAPGSLSALGEWPLLWALSVCRERRLMLGQDPVR